MIRYTLTCAEGHSFESWFRSADAFDALSQAGRITCAVCGGTRVGKAIMAPRVAKRAARATAPEASEPDRDPAGQVAGPAQPPLAAPRPGPPPAEVVRALRAFVESNSTYVGRRFAAEARAIHDGDSPGRAIHGEADAPEVRALLEDGIEVAPLPFLPRAKTN